MKTIYTTSRGSRRSRRAEGSAIDWETLQLGMSYND